MERHGVGIWKDFAMTAKVPPHKYSDPYRMSRCTHCGRPAKTWQTVNGKSVKTWSKPTKNCRDTW